jgi:hypothetical protein
VDRAQQEQAMSKSASQSLGTATDDNNASASADATEALNDEGFDTAAATVATVAVVGVGALVFEAALLPGLALGVAAMLVPKYIPQLSNAFGPVVKSTVRGAYRVGRKTREMVAEAEEHVHDIVAEVNAETAARDVADDVARTRSAGTVRH